MRNILILLFICTGLNAQIIADHNIVDDYDDIPANWIDSVKTMWLSVPGESHSQAYRTGLILLETANADYAVNVIEEGTPESPTVNYLRASRASWGDATNATGWIYTYGEEDWWVNETVIARTKAGLTYANAIGNPFSAFGFGWCYDNSVDPTAYIEATKEYIAYVADSISTTVFFTTGTVDSDVGSDGYYQYLKSQEIRDSVNADPTRILFDYADILTHDADGSENTTTWDGHTYPIITTTNLGDASIGHIGEAGALRLGKALWWMLARIAGWDGVQEEAPAVPAGRTSQGSDRRVHQGSVIRVQL